MSANKENPELPTETKDECKKETPAEKKEVPVEKKEEAAEKAEGGEKEAVVTPWNVFFVFTLSACCMSGYRFARHPLCVHRPFLASSPPSQNDFFRRRLQPRCFFRWGLARLCGGTGMRTA